MTKKIGAVSAAMIDHANMTTKTKRTPGPWGYCGSLIVSSNCVIARVVHRGNQFKDQDPQAPARFTESEANARLIAAAPDLLAAAKSAFEYMANNRADFTETKRSEMGKLKLAILRAEGGK